LSITCIALRDTSANTAGELPCGRRALSTGAMKDLADTVKVDQDWYRFFESPGADILARSSRVWGSFLHLFAGRFVRLEVVSVWREMDIVCC
jgi:hypothetical protein